MTTRSDPHSPANLVTEDYEYVFCADLQSPWALHLSDDFRRELNHLDPATEDRGYGQCHHCGANLRYVAWLRYLPTGYLICVGETCLENRFERATADFQQLRKAAQLDREAQRLLTAYNEQLAELDGDVVYLLLCPDAAFEAAGVTDEVLVAARADAFVTDVRRRARQYGGVTLNQIQALANVPARIIRRMAQEAAQANEVSIPVPTGRQAVTGTVLTTKWQDGQYGSVLKMLVKVTTPAGVYKVWGSVPSALTVDRGDIVSFTATFERSHDDESFGFYKRPTMASLKPAESPAV